MKPVILIIEDRFELRLLEEGALRGAGFSTIWTDSTEEALRVLQTRPVSLVVLDISEVRRDAYGPLIREQGLSFLKQLRTNPSFSSQSLPVVATTEHLPHSAESYVHFALAAGANVFFEQPIDLAEFVAEVKRLSAQTRNR
jgi:CheY-like chemotaxis protein